MELNETKMVR